MQKNENETADADAAAVVCCSIEPLKIVFGVSVLTSMTPLFLNLCYC